MDSMQAFLKKHKIITELTKGVQSMKHYIYPSVLQREAIPVIKKGAPDGQSKNIIIKYQEMSGIKMTVFLPLLNTQIRAAITATAAAAEDDESTSKQTLFTLVLCHSFMRCGEVAEFVQELVGFCAETVQIVNLDTGDLSETMIKLKQAQEEAVEADSDFSSKLIIATPTMALKLLEKDLLKDLKCHSVVLDKVDLMQALDFSDDIQTVGQMLVGDLAPSHSTIFTSTLLDDSTQSVEDKVEFLKVKQSLMGEKKALIIQMKEEIREQSQFEVTQHLYALCETNLDKYILLFSFVKLAIVEGKTIIFVNDIIQAYRIKLFLSRFSLRAFVLSPEMPKNQISSIIHFFHIGQFDIIVMMHTGYSRRPIVKDVVNVINFDVPSSYNGYKENGQLVNDDQGSVLTLVMPKVRQESEDIQSLELIRRKLMKSFGRPDMLKCLPVMWNELQKVKSRVETVLATLNSKNV